MSKECDRNPNTKCLICKRTIYRRPSIIAKNRGNVYCGQACFGKSCRKEIPCLVCGNLILSGANKKTCNRRCSNINRAGIRYKVNRPRDKVKDQRAVKKRLLSKFNEKCQRCECNTRQILVVHHKDRNRKNNDITNLELLCPNCHAKEHYLEKSWLNGKI